MSDTTGYSSPVKNTRTTQNHVARQEMIEQYDSGSSVTPLSGLSHRYERTRRFRQVSRDLDQPKLTCGVRSVLNI